MKISKILPLAAGLLLGVIGSAQDFPPGFDGPPPGGPEFGPMPGGPGGFPGGPGMRENQQIVKMFDRDNNGWLNKEERQAARKFLQQEGNQQRRGPFGGPGRPGPGGGPFGRQESAGTPEPGEKVSPADVKSYGDAPLYSSNIIRTIFLEFDSADWEKELEVFHNTDVDVPAKLTVDGKSYPDVGVRFRGNTSYMMVSSGRKRPLNLTMDLAHENQNLLGFRTLNLLNAHEDPSFLRTVLALEMARAYFPAPRANFVRLVINGEDWGVYANQEQFNKDFLRDRLGTTKGTRWKVPGSPGGRGGLEYLGEDVSQYRSIYQIKSKDEVKAWGRLINLCKVLNETPASSLESKLSVVLDIDSTLRFLAWDNVLAGGDGFWTRASDYTMYEDTQGRFHLVPYDVNETFSNGGGPGGPGGPGGLGRPGGGPGAFGGGPGAPRGLGPGMLLAPALLKLGDKDGNAKLSLQEFEQAADSWYDKMDSDKKGQVTEEQLVDGLNALVQPPGASGGFGPPRGGPPGMFLGPVLFASADTNKDGKLTREEVKALFAKWFKDWKPESADALDEEQIRSGLARSLPPPVFGGSGGRGGPGGRRGGPGGFGGFGPAGGVRLDPLVAAKDSSKPLISRLLAVPECKARYLGYVRHMAEVWLDWNKLGPIAQQHHDLITPLVKADKKKLYSYEQFETSLAGRSAEADSREKSLKSFAEERRAYLLNNADVKGAKTLAP